MVSRLTPEYSAASATVNQDFMLTSAFARVVLRADQRVAKLVARSSAPAVWRTHSFSSADVGMVPTSDRGDCVSHECGGDQRSPRSTSALRTLDRSRRVGTPPPATACPEDERVPRRRFCHDAPTHHGA